MQSGMAIRRRPNRVAVRFWLIAVLAGALLPALAGARPVLAQAAKIETKAPPRVTVPGFWDPRRRPERPDLARIQAIRFLTDLDYPPFDYAGQDGNPVGFNVDLARLICDEVKVACTVQARPFDTLL